MSHPDGSEILSAPLFRSVDDGPLQYITQKRLERLLKIDTAAREFLVAGETFKAAYAKLVEACKPT